MEMLRVVGCDKGSPNPLIPIVSYAAVSAFGLSNTNGNKCMGPQTECDNARKLTSKNVAMHRARSPLDSLRSGTRLQGLTSGVVRTRPSLFPGLRS